MMAAMRQWTIDAFADRPFRGNPACVVEPFEAWPDPAWMQALAQENNQAETAFLLKTDAPDRFGLGAALLTFDTLSGPLTVERDGEGYRMDFPADTPRLGPAPAGLAEALGAEPVECWVGQCVVAILADEAAVRGLKPDLSLLAAVDGGAGWGPGVVDVAALADPASPYQVVSRCFGPAIGIPEDPATGSAHCVLAPIFAEKLGRTRFDCHQAYPGRGGDIGVETRSDRVLLSGRAVTVVDSRLRL
jgi:predicted PhzF superfamily epimerase YddE/YHI9